MRSRYALVRIIQRYNAFMSDHAGVFRPFLEQYTAMVHCPDPLLLESFRLGQADPGAAEAVQQHLQTCAACQQALMALTQTESLLLPPSEAAEAVLSAAADAVFSTDSADSPVLQPGQIWSTHALLDLTLPGLAPAGTAPVSAGFARLFLVTALGPLQLGRFREVTLCPLSEWTELVSAQDLILPPEDNPFEETLVLQTWNQAQALALHLEQYHGALPPSVWMPLQTWLAAKDTGAPLPAGIQQGGQLISAQGPHAAFQQTEREQLAYLQLPLAALATLRRQASACLLRVSPQGLLPPPAAAPEPALFAPFYDAADLPVLAAATAAPEAPEKPVQRYIHRLQLSEQLRLDLWLAGSQLAFYAYTHEQLPLAGLEIFVPTRDEGCELLITDALGTAALDSRQLPPRLILLEVQYPPRALKTWVPVFYADTGTADAAP